MNSIQLEKILSHMPHFGGVFAADNINIEKVPCFIIVNTDSQTLNGKHWISMYLSEKQSEFFDSLGQSPDKYHKYWDKILKKISKTYIYNTQRLQGYSSSTCGQYCLYFILKRLSGKHFQSILNDFDLINLKKNDAFVVQFVNNYIDYLAL